MHPLGKTRPEIQLGHSRQQFFFAIRHALTVHPNSTNQPFQAKHKLTSSHPKVCDAHLNRWSTLPIKITLLITPRCVPHILTGNMQSTKLQCLRQKIMQTDANMQNSLTTNCQSMHNPSHDCKTDHSGFPRMKPIDMSCSKDENQCKTHDSWHQNCSNSVSQVQILSSPVQSSPKSSKTLKFPNWQWAWQQKLPRHLKTTNPFQSKLDSSLYSICVFSATEGRCC